MRDDEGHWSKMEQFFTDHTDTELSHGLCPECARMFLEKDGG